MSLEYELLTQRYHRIREIEALGFKSYGQRFDFTHTLAQIVEQYGDKTAEQLEPRVEVKVCGRIQTIRRMGKAGFAHLLQGGEKLQIYVRKDAVDEKSYALYQLLDIGDIVGASGYLFRTRTGELSVHVEQLTFLAKTLLSMPEKWHGLEDVETRYRQRYLDLIANPEVRKTFYKRAKIISSFRRQLEDRGFVEVETPMMQPIFGGAAAKPFVTHHNTLDIDLYLRIAPELYLKRLVVGGLDRVYEINRNFRNEGISTKHNPEFTMLEFYQAYTDYRGLMDLSEELLRQTAIDVNGTTEFEFDGRKYDFARLRRFTMREAIVEFWRAGDKPTLDQLMDPEWLSRHSSKATAGEALVDLFERVAEPHLLDPTIVYEFPVEVSPLAKNNPDDPRFADRFEILVAGMEIGNAYTELNDPQEQRRRFEIQLAMRERGNEEAHQMDEDYIRALCYGMPPTAGEGIGIDRLTMLLTGSKSIRDVILFPLLRPEGEIGLLKQLRSLE
ncbi:MAG: lysine--tRNA ligase [Bryobacteraceae bacterium]|nr:lysine--tRNA ligase [Bryobacteraceae bacterium]MDW8380369.1 lysine--tRNA ligase [Bryobacterales bacterium]